MKQAYFEITLPIIVKKEEGLFISCCPVLDIHAQGKTLTEAKKNIADVVRLFITNCFERGTLDAVLKECGFHALKKDVAIPKDHNYIKVPIPFNVSGGCPAECNA